MRVALSVLVVLGVGASWACGGKAVIDGEPGAGGSGAFGGAGPGGMGGSGLEGGGGSGASTACGFVGTPGISVSGDGDPQFYTAAGPDPEFALPYGRLLVGEGGSVRLTLKGCASNGATNNCIDLDAPGVAMPGASTSNARVEYTGPQGIVFIGDEGEVELDYFGPVGDFIAGVYAAEVRASGGANERFLEGSFTVCRVPDVFLP